MLQIYTGNGKGKTTAALGLSLRAAGAGFRVFFAQMMKNTHTSELESLKLLGDRITVKRFGTGEFIVETPTVKDFECAEQAFAAIEEAALSGQFQMVVADEMCTALYYELINRDNLLLLIKNCPPTTELIFTGRYADEEMIGIADLVTEMREVKHCYQKNVPARKGIEF
ncbi:MAG: cob(I)yrinic acid a,c-diamide adenosyltransferase [Chitinispirillia bacterium]|nr:cob(I)yrinic acid a,c-diamide adenosyltransferase [Chitinispirillia bacterium]MCL2240963.1 cob(I)yrinic acid a,c-diamide adenosyltransferase [Chitinispirillia bacterium]